MGDCSHIKNPPPHDWRGRGFDRQLSVYKIDLTFSTALYNQPLHRPGQPTMGRGPKTRAPRYEGEEAAYSTLGQEHCLQDRGHRWVQFLCGFPRGSSHHRYELSSNNGEMNRCCKETSDLENPWTREVMEPSTRWGPATQLLGEAIQIALMILFDAFNTKSSHVCLPVSFRLMDLVLRNRE